MPFKFNPTTGKLDLVNPSPTETDPVFLAQGFISAGKAGGQTAIGGTGVTDILKLQGTSGNGDANNPSVQFLGGYNGDVLGGVFFNDGSVGIGATFIEDYAVGTGNKLEVQNGYIMISNAEGNGEKLRLGSAWGCPAFWNQCDEATLSLVIGNEYPNDIVFLSFAGDGLGGISESLRITATKDIGINTPTPSGKLDVHGAGTTTGVLFELSDSTGTPRVTVLDNGATTVVNQITSSLAVGTSPFAVTSTTVNTNLNAELWNGKKLVTGSGTLTAGTTTTVTITGATATSIILIEPTSAAFTALGAYISAKNSGSFVITHGISAGTEIFDYIIVS